MIFASFDIGRDARPAGRRCNNFNTFAGDDARFLDLCARNGRVPRKGLALLHGLAARRMRYPVPRFITAGPALVMLVYLARKSLRRVGLAGEPVKVRRGAR